MMRISVILLGSLLCTGSAQASEWSGSSLPLRSSVNGIPCKAGPVQLSIDGEIVNGSANRGTLLSGRLAGDGSISLSGGRGGGLVTFGGKMTGNRLRGSWVAALTGCRGTWNADLIAEEVQPPPALDDASILMPEPKAIEPGEPTIEPTQIPKTD